ncbi:MAG: hypothetical protein ACE361_26255 [Aureliella sp.]
MKRLLFEKLTLLSQTEKKARVLPFHEKATVIKGENDVGKSSVVKSLFKTFGTQPHKETPRWKQANVQSIVDFTVDRTSYSLLRSRDSYGLFDGNGDILETFTSVTNELSPRLSRIFNFHLTLDARGSESLATPAFMFLPFYADQDKSWISSLDGFERLQQFRNYRKDVVWFHTGIRPNEYYIAKAERGEALAEQESLQGERESVQLAVNKVNSLFAKNQFSLSIEDFQSEVQNLVDRSRELLNHESKLKERIVQSRNLQIAIDSQIAIVVAAARELGDDFTFAATELDDSIECPTCGAHYENSIAERFAIAADENRCRELIEELQNEKRRLQEEYESALKESEEVAAERSHVDGLLAQKKSDVTFQEILQSEGRREVKEALQTDIDSLNLRIGKLDSAIVAADKRMKQATNTKRTKRITAFFREMMSEFLDELRVRTVTPEQYLKIDARINESGSDGPRALLAYQFAILHTINEYSTSVFCPVIIDSPNQQDQDEENLGRIREFIRDRLPTDAQLMLCLVDDGDVDYGGKVYEFNRKYSVLTKADFSDASERIGIMMDKMIAARAKLNNA